MIVLKIGGTSMGDASRMDRALDIATEQISRSPLMVCSAMGGVTDTLIDATEAAATGNAEEAVALVESIKTRHKECGRDFLEGDILENLFIDLDGLFGQVFSLLKGISLLREASDRSRDALLSYGERLSTRLITARGMARGIDVALLDAREMIRTDRHYTAARPVPEETERLTRLHARPEPGRLLITQGFIGSDADGVTTTLGRGGSDYTASLLGAALDAEEIQIWTDVDGMMTCDPRIVPQAVTIPRISFEEAGELAFFGAKVVHPATIQPAVAAGIPVFVRNTGAPDRSGTRIGSETSDRGLKAISGKRGITVVNVTSSRMLEAYGFLQRIFAIFAEAETPVDLVTTSEVSVSVTIERTDRLDEIKTALEDIGTVGIERDLGIVCLVGKDLWKDTAFHPRVFSALGEVPVRMISLGASEVNLSLVVPTDRIDEAMIRLHRELIA